MPPKLQKPKLCYHAKLAGKLPFRHGKLRSLSQGKNAKVTSSCKVKLWRQAGGLLAHLPFHTPPIHSPTKCRPTFHFGIENNFRAISFCRGGLRSCTAFALRITFVIGLCCCAIAPLGKALQKKVTQQLSTESSTAQCGHTGAMQTALRELSINLLHRAENPGHLWKVAKICGNF